MTTQTEETGMMRQLKKMIDAYAEMSASEWLDCDYEDEHECEGRQCEYRDEIEQYGIKFVITPQGHLSGVIVMLAGGGPTVWMDTNFQEIRGSWGGEEYRRDMWYGTTQEINEHFECDLEVIIA